MGVWEGARRKGGFSSCLPQGGRKARSRRLRLLLSLTPPPAPLYLRGTPAGGGGAQTGPGDNCQLEVPLGVGEGRGRKRWGRALNPPGWGELVKEAKKGAPSPSLVRMRSRARPTSLPRACVLPRDEKTGTSAPLQAPSRAPGIKPGSPAWQARTLSLGYHCLPYSLLFKWLST
ncbi:uncharacterized protein LOC143673566 [Tamandua tetradactyla]|uniref:uncharacterized protein LOC143673566 n=1 Tax=Tamandua tetradactyla TaxID=48850 RepID=UPI004053A512